MDKNKVSIEAFWQAYLTSLPESAPRPTHYNAWSFGDSPEMADELGNLVKSGVKTATCSSLESFELSNDSVPKAGEFSVVLDGRGEPLCITKTTGVEIKPYNEVGADFAHAEGEGDRSLEYWRKEHKRYFTREGAGEDSSFDETMPLVCERFRLVYS